MNQKKGIRVEKGWVGPHNTQENEQLCIGKDLLCVVVLVVHCTTEGGTVQIVVCVNDIKRVMSYTIYMATYGHT